MNDAIMTSLSMDRARAPSASELAASELPLSSLREAFEEVLALLATQIAEDETAPTLTWAEARAREAPRRWLSPIGLLEVAPVRSVEELIVPVLEGEGEGEARTREGEAELGDARLGAALVLLHLDKARGPNRALDLLAETSELDAQGRQALRTALALWDDSRADALAEAGLERASTDAQAPWIELMVDRGRAPGSEVLERALASGVPALQRAALRALPLRPEPHSFQAKLVPSLFAEEVDVRVAAMITGLVVGDHMAKLICRQMSRDFEITEARELLAGLGSPADCQFLRSWVEQVPAPAHALWCLGFSGRVSGIEACVAALDADSAESAQAGLEGFCLATGFAPAATSDTSAPEQARAWWDEHRARFDPTRRYLRGRERGLEPIRAELASGPRRARDALARELWVRSCGRIHVWGGALLHVRVRALATLEDAELDFEAALLDPTDMGQASGIMNPAER